MIPKDIANKILKLYPKRVAVTAEGVKYDDNESIRYAAKIGAQLAIDHLANQKPTGWIDATKSTPPLIEGKDYSEQVWAIESGERRVMCYCYIPGEDGGFVWADCGGNIDGDAEFDDDYNVTHWQPFPTTTPLYSLPIPSELEEENQALKATLNHVRMWLLGAGQTDSAAYRRIQATLLSYAKETPNES